MAEEKGFCACGCGQKTPLAIRNRKSRGHIKGQPMKWCYGHQARGRFNGNWKGGRCDKGNYPMVLMRDHPRALPNGYVYEHILRAEKALGKLLPRGAQVHHHTATQLVICQDQKYHRLLHKREAERRKFHDGASTGD